MNAFCPFWVQRHSHWNWRNTRLAANASTGTTVPLPAAHRKMELLPIHRPSELHSATQREVTFLQLEGKYFALISFPFRSFPFHFHCHSFHFLSFEFFPFPLNSLSFPFLSFPRKYYLRCAQSANVQYILPHPPLTISWSQLARSFYIHLK